MFTEIITVCSDLSPVYGRDRSIDFVKKSLIGKLPLTEIVKSMNL